MALRLRPPTDFQSTLGPFAANEAATLGRQQTQFNNDMDNEFVRVRNMLADYQAHYPAQAGEATPLLRDMVMSCVEAVGRARAG